jgi:hypothetical protein
MILMANTFVCSIDIGGMITPLPPPLNMFNIHGRLRIELRKCFNISSTRKQLEAVLVCP